ncbi:hypothetical protein [Proteus mirabilis]|uniref:hypothetical protein n=1 Tax=Proteus mirabilis TaxID=584 RepID=UPI001261E918|nr:hypothetical protein [Proteus mirabilis]
MPPELPEEPEEIIILPPLETLVIDLTGPEYNSDLEDDNDSLPDYHTLTPTPPPAYCRNILPRLNYLNKDCFIPHPNLYPDFDHWF